MRDENYFDVHVVVSLPARMSGASELRYSSAPLDSIRYVSKWARTTEIKERESLQLLIVSFVTTELKIKFSS